MSKSRLHGAQTSVTYRKRLEETQQRQQEGRRLVEGLKEKDLIGIPWMLAFALRNAGWYLRAENIWAKGSCLPESVQDRTTRSHEQVFMFSKQPRYFYDADAIREPASQPERIRADRIGGNKHNGTKHSDQSVFDGSVSRNKRSVWHINAEPFKGSHYAVMPTKLAEICILAGTSSKGCCAECGAPWKRVTERTDVPDPSYNGSAFDIGKTGTNGNGRVQHGERYLTRPAGWKPTCAHNAEVVPCVVLDPFGGSGTTARVAAKHHRKSILIELNPEYIKLVDKRITVQPTLVLNGEVVG